MHLTCKGVALSLSPSCFPYVCSGITRGTQCNEAPSLLLQGVLGATDDNLELTELTTQVEPRRWTGLEAFDSHLTVWSIVTDRSRHFFFTFSFLSPIVPSFLRSCSIFNTFKKTAWNMRLSAHRNKGLERLSCSAYPIRKVPKIASFWKIFSKPRDLKAGSFLINEVGRPKLPTLEVNSEPYS